MHSNKSTFIHEHNVFKSLNSFLYNSSIFFSVTNPLISFLVLDAMGISFLVLFVLKRSFPGYLSSTLFVCSQCLVVSRQHFSPPVSSTSACFSGIRDDLLGPPRIFWRHIQTWGRKAEEHKGKKTVTGRSKKERTPQSLICIRSRKMVAA